LHIAQYVQIMSLLQVNRLSKHFIMHHLRREVMAFDCLTFDVREGEFVLVVGPNGVGKSTLMGMIARNTAADISPGRMWGDMCDISLALWRD
jgi:alpha-D-ribose 1-methylphosphonate 5-triphosphate synthase subunit PhnL